MFEIVDEDDDGRTPDHGSGELKIVFFLPYLTAYVICCGYLLESPRSVIIVDGNSTFYIP